MEISTCRLEQINTKPQNNGKNNFGNVVPKKFEKRTKNTKKYKLYKNSQKPAKRQSDRHRSLTVVYDL